MTLGYKDATRPESERVADLLSRMTLDEKIAQMRLLYPVETILEGPSLSSGAIKKHLGNGIGGAYCTTFLAPDLLNGIQKYLLEETRLGIPLLMMGESLHGTMNRDATVFPQAIGLGASWSTQLMHEVVNVIGRETRALGITQTYAPNLDLSRDPRWGRVEENYGEDPYLTARLGVEYVKTLQSHGVAASLKHYVAHGSPEGGINLAPVHAGERELRDTMLPPFAAAIREAGAMSIMPAYSEWDGTPVHASRFLMTDLLRKELGFDGFTVSDFGAIEMLHYFHKTAANALEAGKQALWAGLDMEAPNIFGFGPDLVEAVQRGEVPLEWVDLAVQRILRIKFRLRLFENPYAANDRLDLIHNEEAIRLSRKAAHETVVLLKNDTDLLPLSDRIGRVALIGPNAECAQLGDYTPPAAAERSVSLWQGLVARLGADRVQYAKGCNTNTGSDEEMAQAVAVARSCRVVILALGDSSHFYGGIGWGDKDGKTTVTCGEGFDMSDLKLPGRQQELLEKVAATGTPVVLVLMTGRPYCINWAKQNIPAILQAWYPGEQGGHALCDVLFGDVNPSGKLPISFPQSVGHIPCFYNHKVSARGYYKQPGTVDKPGRDYVFSSPEPLFPFGFGLSYTTFAYSDLVVTPEKVGAEGAVVVSVSVTNTGKREGQEVVQLYLTDCVSRITPFVKRLRGFSKIALSSGESRRVSFVLDQKDFAFLNEKMQPEVEPGEFVVAIAGLQAKFTVVNARTFA